MKTYLLPFFLLCFCSLNAQNSPKKKIEIGVTTGLDYTLQEKSAIASSNSKLKQSRPNIGFSIAIPLSEKWYFKSGLSFGSYGNRYKSDDLRWGSEHDENGNYEPDPSLPKSIVVDDLDYHLHIPIHAQYRFKGNERLHPFVEFGVGVNPYLYSKSKITYDGTSSETTRQRNGASNNILSADIGGGLLWQLSPTSDKYQLLVAPGARYFIDFKNYDAAFISKLFTLELAMQVGLVMKIGS